MEKAQKATLLLENFIATTAHSSTPELRSLLQLNMLGDGMVLIEE